LDEARQGALKQALSVGPEAELPVQQTLGGAPVGVDGGAVTNRGADSHSCC
jgi:hypothetical protein